MKKTYQLGGDPRFEQIAALLKDGPGEGRYMGARKLAYEIAKNDFREPSGGLSVQPKSDGIYVITSGGYARTTFEVDTDKHTLSVDGKEKDTSDS